MADTTTAAPTLSRGTDLKRTTNRTTQIAGGGRAGLTAGVLPAAFCSILPHDETETAVPRLLICRVLRFPR